jgi:hypothetical protein
MSDSAIAEERRNRLLKCQIEHAKADQIRLMGEVSELEKKHMDLVQCDLQVDWDLRYTNFNDDEPFSENESEDFSCHRIDLTEKYKMLAANGQKENIAKEIVILELEKRRKNNPYGVFGEAIPLNDRKISGPAKYHGAEF